ncbi:MAG: hypothetical protein MUF27_17305 [Acidobacteria bacterium]|jgi:hypothetical protein|nr:hypothetical protein [Acidobacteriota bacterium]
MKIDRRAMGLALGLALLAVAGCASGYNDLPQEPGFSPRLNRFTYIEEGKLVALAADTEAAIQREKQKFIPIGVGIANLGLDKALTLGRESFTLVDDQGKKYSLATVQEARSLAGLQIFDVKLSENFVGVLDTRFITFPDVPMVFFPVQSTEPQYSRRGIVRDRVELPLRTWAWDILYFPHPEGKLKGRKYELWLDAPELKEPIFVRFAVK